ncbi:Unconventional prefoldin RPB5 interactor-like protein [Gryllus bimaculatus]|nr:Unconventional prefoldin RPB5 interactor-like protein [Gryllus bimaculatus]
MHDVGNASVNYPQLLHQTYNEALLRNELAQKHWQKLKEEYMTLESFLNDLPKELSKDVMVPVAPRALMRGKIAHSNEILVCLGQGYFVKRSAIQAVEICKRREKICSDMLESLEKERNLFIGRQELPLQQDAFGGVREIIEEYNEEEETHWKAEHKKKEREYRQKLAELRTKEKTAVVDEESLWQRLDELELQEELEEELDRLHAEESDVEEEEDEEGEEEDDEEEEKGNERDTKKEGMQSEKDLPKEEMHAKCPSLGRRVSFAALAGDENGDEELRIVFHHSNVSPPDPTRSEIIQSPAELYLHFKNVFLTEPKSILKKTSSYENSFDNTYGEDSHGEVTEYESAVDLSSPTPPPPPPIREEVVERVTNVSSSTPAVDRPVSRFKALRQQKKR